MAARLEINSWEEGMNKIIGLEQSRLKEVKGAIYKEQRLFPYCSLRQIKKH